MPRTQEVVSATVQGYALEDGAIAMCFATFYPSPRAGRDWRFFANFFAEVEAWQRSTAVVVSVAEKAGLDSVR